MGPKRRFQAAYHRTKILCTVGPSVASPEKLYQLLSAGADAFRLNFSHGSEESHATYVQWIREVEQRIGHFIPIVLDLPGPKLRVGTLPSGAIELRAGEEVVIVDVADYQNAAASFPPGTAVVPVEYPTVAKDLKEGDSVLLDDGRLRLRVSGKRGRAVRAVVIVGGILQSRKGINVPGVRISMPTLTERDRQGIRFAARYGCDYVALSFVRSAEDVVTVRELLRSAGSMAWVIAKIERPEALANIEQIVQVADGIMIARGDLGIEIPAVQVPLVQKRLIALANSKAKLAITATQMLESMVQNPMPTRAEASDVANAVLDGTDVVMLSAETSVGAYPTEAVLYMRSICQEAEQAVVAHPEIVRTLVERESSIEKITTDAIAAAAAAIAAERHVSGIVSLTLSGETVRLVSKRRPPVPIIAATQSAMVARNVSLLWGTMGIVLERVGSTDETIEEIKELLRREGYFMPGERVVVTIGRPLVARSRTNMLSIETI
ncbi:MAG: pyruvate kinase [Candidatus Kapabacteria bacterium]|nr:pyruvate kinase [Candidatus Kapabacteria bacterium]MDW8011490.1 pyruvate kinase [Bacteroidota bacterium]